MKLVILARLLRFCYMNRSWVRTQSGLLMLTGFHSLPVCITVDDELEMIRQSSMYEETIKQKNFIEKEFLAVKQILGKCDIIGRDDDNEDDEEDGMHLDFFLLQERKRKPYETQNIRNRNWRHKSKLKDNFWAKKMANLRRVFLSSIARIPNYSNPTSVSSSSILSRTPYYRKNLMNLLSSPKFHQVLLIMWMKRHYL